jgi:cell division protein FtsX
MKKLFLILFFIFALTKINLGQENNEDKVKLVIKLRNTPEDDISNRIILLDKILNVVHPRSDLASLFVKGGSKALSNLSASPSERAEEKSK